VRKKIVQIALDADTAEFLELARSGNATDNISDFINSLLRQERFRQGFPAYHGQGIPAASITSLSDKILAKRRGF
jgi:hypothetical protein